MPAIYSQFRDALLIALARRTERDGLRDYSLDEVADEAGIEGGRDRVRMACGELELHGYIRDHSTLGGSAGMLLGPGMEEAERLMAAEERVVEVDHSRLQYRELVAALEDLAQAIRNNNEYRAKEPAEQEQRLAEVEATSVLVRASQVRVVVIESLASGLSYLAEKFGHALIGQLASKAAAKLIDLL